MFLGKWCEPYDGVSPWKWGEPQGGVSPREYGDPPDGVSSGKWDKPQGDVTPTRWRRPRDAARPRRCCTPRNGINLEMVHGVTWRATNRLCPSDMGWTIQMVKGFIKSSQKWIF